MYKCQKKAVLCIRKLCPGLLFGEYHHRGGYIEKTVKMLDGMDEDTQKDICLSVQKEKLLRELLRQKEADEKAG